MGRSPNRFYEGTTQVEGDLLEVFGFDSLQRHGDPLDAQPSQPKRRIFELRGPGEVNQRRLRRACVREQ